AMAKAGKGLLEGTLQAGTSAVSDKLLDLVGLGGKSAADKGKDTRDYLAAAFPELNAWERFLKASHSFRNRLLVICKNAYLFATMIMTSVSSPFSCCSGIVRLNLM